MIYIAPPSLGAKRAEWVGPREVLCNAFSGAYEQHSVPAAVNGPAHDSYRVRLTVAYTVQQFLCDALHLPAAKRMKKVNPVCVDRRLSEMVVFDRASVCV